jgi:hypothetical protein
VRLLNSRPSLGRINLVNNISSRRNESLYLTLLNSAASRLLGSSRIASIQIGRTRSIAGSAPDDNAPFSEDPRKCIGKSFAGIEMHIHLMMIAKDLRLRCANGEQVQLAAGVNLRNKYDFIMALEINRWRSSEYDERGSPLFPPSDSSSGI